MSASRPARPGGAGSDSPLRFFVLVFALSVPFWLIGAFAARAGVGLPFHLPLSALMLVCPVAAAAILSWRSAGPSAVRGLFTRTFDAGRISGRIRYLPLLLTIPAIHLLSYVVMQLMGRPVTPPGVSDLPALDLQQLREERVRRRRDACD